MTDPDPLILTLRFDPASFERFDASRRAHFPAKRNLIPAHLTLFHKLPAEEEERIVADLREFARQTTILLLHVTGLRFLGYGSAFVVKSRPLEALRAEFARRWQGSLTPQDTQPFSGHVTIQNKVPATQAKALFAELNDVFEPFEAEGIGLLLWRYRGGPWEPSGEFAFEGCQT